MTKWVGIMSGGKGEQYDMAIVEAGDRKQAQVRMVHKLKFGYALMALIPFKQARGMASRILNYGKKR